MSKVCKRHCCFRKENIKKKERKKEKARLYKSLELMFIRGIN